MAEKSDDILVLILTKGHELVETGKCTRIVKKERCVIGRGSGSDWTLPDPNNEISRRHCTIDWHEGKYRVADTSSNGTYLNDWDEPIATGEFQDLSDGDILRIGRYYISIQMFPEEAKAPPQFDDFLLKPSASDPLQEALPEGQPDELFDTWIDDQVVSRDDELSEGLNDPLDEPERILRQTTERFEFPESGGDYHPTYAPLTQDYMRYNNVNPVPFESESGVSSEQGTSAWDHNRSETDAFKLPRVNNQTIPEDWDTSPPSESKVTKDHEDK